MHPKKDKLEQIRSMIGNKRWAAHLCLRDLAMLEAEAVDESGFNEADNTSVSDPEALKEVLESIADEAVSRSRRVSEQLTEISLELDRAAVLRQCISESDQ